MNYDEIIKERRNKKRKKKIIRVTVFLFVLTLALLIFAEIKVTPIVSTMARQRARSLAAYIISDAVCDRLSDENISYNSLVALQTDSEGKITALTTDIVKINHLKSNLTSEILRRLSNSEETKIKIPLGNILSGSFFSGKGPRIEFSLVPASSVISDFSNVFSSAGINQTHHQIMVDVKVSISILMPFLTLYETVESSVCVAETVIVGSVPEAFTNVENQGNASISDEIVDFGAHNFIN